MAKQTDKARKGSGKRRRFKGKMVLPNGEPRSHTHGGHSQARRGWTCGDVQAFPRGIETKNSALGPYRVIMPRGRIRYVRPS